MEMAGIARATLSRYREWRQESIRQHFEFIDNVFRRQPRTSRIRYASYLENVFLEKRGQPSTSST